MKRFASAVLGVAILGHACAARGEPAALPENGPDAPFPVQAEDMPLGWHRLPSDLPPARELLNDAVARLPRERTRMTGRLQSRTPGGRTECTLNTEIVLDWGADPPAASYTIRDAFGGEPERLTVKRRQDAEPSYLYEVGDPPRPAPPPELSASIKGTDLTWADLSLSFLWARDARTEGRDTVKGRACYVVVVPAAGADDAGGPHGTLRIWIDRKFRMVLRAAEYDTDGHIRRRLSIKTVKKIDDRWTIKDLEVRTYPARHRTLLRVDEVEVLSAPPPPAATSPAGPETE
ncbi:MAG: outer membrane lipoprotein-sorting protein [Kiritimatiellae bacterium]|nr:outer membrane lipoprotein-sorting protein [Kiritimatiellia bacterium]